MLVPKLFTTLRNYSREAFLKDVSAGVIVGIVALPLAIAFAIASGVSPERGLLTAIIAGFLISVLGGSKVQIGGPTGAFVVILYNVVQRFGLNGLIIATMMAGVMLVIMGIARFGTMIKFIPSPVVTGFTSGIAVIIFSSQVKDFLGLSIGTVPTDFLEKWKLFAENSSSLNLETLAVSVLALVIILGWSRINKKIPSPFVALILTTVVVQLFHLPVETIGSRFGAISSSFPTPAFPTINYTTLVQLFPSALTIALLAAIESLLSAMVADGMIGSKHRSNMELVAQGVANILTPLFGGIAATGAIARTATNVKNGGRTPVAGIVHSLTLLSIMLFVGQWATMIPLASLAAILVVVAYNMSEWRTFHSLLRAPRSDVAVLLTTFFLTVIVDLTVAIEAGMVMAAFLFMRRMSLVTNVSVMTSSVDDEDEEGDVNSVGERIIPRDVSVYEIRGPFFFGAVEKFKETIPIVENFPKVIIIRMRDVPAVDASGLHALEDLLKKIKSKDSLLLLSDIHTQPMVAAQRSGLLTAIGEENVFGNLDDALVRAREHLGLPPLVPVKHFSPTVKRELE